MLSSKYVLQHVLLTEYLTLNRYLSFPENTPAFHQFTPAFDENTPAFSQKMPGILFLTSDMAVNTFLGCVPIG